MGLPNRSTVTFLFTDIEGSTRLERAAARIAVVGNDGQIVLSDVLVAALGPGFYDGPEFADIALSDDGLRAVKDFEEPARLYRLVVPGVADDTRRLRTPARRMSWRGRRGSCWPR